MFFTLPKALADMDFSLRRLLEPVADAVFQSVRARQLSIQNQIAENITRRIAEKCSADNAAIFDNEWDLREFVAKLIDPKGALLEFGVFTGGTINFMSKRVPEGNFDGFDTFEGLPSGKGVWKNYFEKKKFDIGGRLPTVNSNVTLHKGLIEDTLPPFVKSEMVDKIASYIHVDVDIYDATAAIFKNMAPYIRPSTIVLFDEFCNYDAFYSEEYRAFREFVQAHNVSYTILAVGSNQRRFGSLGKLALRIDAIKPFGG